MQPITDGLPFASWIKQTVLKVTGGLSDTDDGQGVRDAFEGMGLG